MLSTENKKKKGDLQLYQDSSGTGLGKDQDLNAYFMSQKLKNRNIAKVSVKNEKLLIAFTNGKQITIPAEIDNKPVPINDPYDKSTGHGCMVENAILQSGLSKLAKLAYWALRSHLCYGLGVTFITMETLASDMSCERKAAGRAIKELEDFGVIRIGRNSWLGRKKNFIAFCLSTEWHLPEKPLTRIRNKKKIKQTGQRVVSLEDVLAM